MLSEDKNVRISSSCFKQLLTIKGEILLRDQENKPIRTIIEEMVEKCHSSIDSLTPLNDLSQVEK